MLLLELLLELLLLLLLLLLPLFSNLDTLNILVFSQTHTMFKDSEDENSTKIPFRFDPKQN